MTKFLTSLDCKVCGKPMKLIEPDGGFTGGWPEEDERGNTIAEHWSRDWFCECGVHASEGAVDNDPFNDDPDADYLMPDGEPLEWYGKDGKAPEDESPDYVPSPDAEDASEPFFFQPGGDPCPHCGSTNTERIDTVSDDPVIWACQCGSCAETFEVLIPPSETMEAQLPPELQHDGFYYTTPAGVTAHVQGNPNMSQEALDALSRMIDHVAKSIDDGTFGKKLDDNQTAKPLPKNEEKLQE